MTGKTSTGMRKLRIVLWALVVVAAAGAGFLAYGPRPTGVSEVEAIYAKPFQLVDQNGAAVT